VYSVVRDPARGRSGAGYSVSKTEFRWYFPHVDYGLIIFLAVGLAMDATAVSAARGFAVNQLRVRNVVTIALFFGGFQAIMPAIGWIVGSHFGPVVENWDHWIAFFLLTGIGGRMLWESLRPPKSELPSRGDPFGTKVILLLAIATSIDALAAGISLPMLHQPLLPSILIIGVITAVLSAGGLFAGRRFGAMLGVRLDATGGIVLVVIGCKILIQHLTT